MRRRLVPLVAVLCLGILGVAGDAQASLPTGNLLQNPGAEQGGNGSDTGFPPPAWTTTTGFVAERYGAQYRPEAAVGSAIQGGSYAFAGGSDASLSLASQVIDVSAAASEIDGGKVFANLSGYLGGYADERDYAEMFLERGSSLGFVTIGQTAPVTVDDRANQTKFLLRNTSAHVPANTRQLRVTIRATRKDGTYTDGYADNLALTLSLDPAYNAFIPPNPTTQPPPTRTTKTGKVTGIKRKGKKVTGKVSAGAPCKAGRKVVLNKKGKKIASAKSKAGGQFTLKSKKAKKGKLTVKVKKRTVSNTVCEAVSKKI